MHLQKSEDCDIIQLTQRYPFGQQNEPFKGAQTVLVRKRLFFESTAQWKSIMKKVQLLKSFDNKNLIQVKNTKQTQSNIVQLVYEYVPLGLQRWILDMGQELINQIEFEMLSLASYLTDKNIKFQFQPANLGLSKDIKTRYFLHDFSVDPENKIKNHKRVQQQIRSFFKEFRGRQEKKIRPSVCFLDRKSADSTFIYQNLETLASENTRESWDGNRRSKLIKVKSRKNLIIQQKVENSKKKHLQIMHRLNNLKRKTE